MSERGLQANGLRELAAARARAAAAPAPAPAPEPPWLAVTGAKGGVGKTLVAVNLALQLARTGLRTLLVDLDPGCGNVDVHLRLARRHGLDDAVRGEVDVDACLVDGPFGLRVLAGHSGALTLTAETATAAVLATVARAATGHDLVVCDTGAGLGALALATAARAEVTLAVTTADPSALTDTYAQCKMLRARGQPLPRLLLNGVRNRDEALRTAGRFGAACRRFLGQEPLLFGWLHRDPALERSVLEQRPLGLAAGGDHQELMALRAAALAALPQLPVRSPRAIAAFAAASSPA